MPTSARASPATSRSTSRSSPRPWTPRPRPRWRSPWPRPAAWASCYNLEPEEQAAQVRQVKKFEASMVVNPVTIHPGATLAGARPDEGPQHLRHSGGRRQRQRRGRQARRHPHQPRRALRHRPAQKVAELMTKAARHHAREQRRPGRGKRLLHQHRIEKLLVVDDSIAASG